MGTDQFAGPEPVTVTLDGDEAAVLFHLLSRWCLTDGPTPPESCFDHPAEVHALRALFHEFLPRFSSGEAEAAYDQRVQSASRQIMDRYETSPMTLND